MLHLATHTGVAGGGAVQMARMAIGLRERGHHVVCAFNWRDFRQGEGERNFEPLEKHGVPHTAFRMEAFISKVFGDRRRFLKFVEEHRFDIVHVHKPRALRFALSTFPEDITHPAIVSQRGNCYRIDDHTRRLLNDRRVKAVVCVAKEVENVVKAGGIEPEKVITVYGGVHPREFDPTIDPVPVRRELGIPEGAPVIGIVANFDGKKGHRGFFEAAVELVRRVPEIRFLVVGRGAPGDLLEKLRQMGIAERVIVTGFREDVPRLLAVMDVSVNVSTRGEGLTGAMRESLCMKRPVVCTDVGGNRELVRDGETGRLVPPGNKEAFVEAVVDLLENREKARAMAEAGYRLVLAEFTEEVRISRLEHVYYNIIAGRAVDAGLAPVSAAGAPAADASVAGASVEAAAT